jgi:hypothetical protein
MQVLITKCSVAYLIFLYSIAYTVSALAANNSIYLTQSGSSALTLNITQTGGGNVVGTSNARATLSGNSMTVDLDQIGTGNTLAATVAQANSSSFTLRSTGDTNVSTLTVGGTGDTAGLRPDRNGRLQYPYIRTGRGCNSNLCKHRPGYYWHLQ